MSEKIVQLNEEVIKGQLKELVRGSVEETLNGLLEAEAEKLTQAGRYERNEQRQGYRSGHYNRSLRYRQVLCVNSFSNRTERNLHRAGESALDYRLAEGSSITICSMRIASSACSPLCEYTGTSESPSILSMCG